MRIPRNLRVKRKDEVWLSARGRTTHPPVGKNAVRQATVAALLAAVLLRLADSF